MRHFFSKDTVEASIWCTKCGKETPHAIMGGRPAHCKVCQAKPLEPSKPQDSPVERSGDLFE
jgi:DNA-directed RNA polymerase subunit RPC12/RpoP